MADHRYRKVQPRMWADEKIQRLTWPPPGGLALFQYLMTGRETVALPGALDVTESGLAERLRWSVEGLRKAFEEVFREGLAKADWKAGLVWLPGGPKNNKPQSPNVVRHWGSAFNELPECELKSQIYHDVKKYAESLGEGYAKAFLESFHDAFAKSVAVAVAEEVTVVGAGLGTPFPIATTAIPGQPLPDRIAEAYREVSSNTDLGEISATWTQRQRDAIREMSVWCSGDLAKLRAELELLRNDQWLARQPVHIWASRIGTGDSVSKNGRKRAMSAPTAAEFDTSGAGIFDDEPPPGAVR